MKMLFVSAMSICLLINYAVSAIPKPDEKRVLDHDPLSHAQHYQNDEHNKQYDHEAFLGEDAKTFDQLEADESRRRLGLIVDKIDGDSDGFVNLSELKAWIQYTQRRYIDDDVNRQWKTHNPNNTDKVHWDTYRKNVYGFLDELASHETDHPSDEHFSYRAMMKRDRRRWSIADRDGDDELTREEFTDFLHPEESTQMRDVVVTETIEDIDKDNDGKVSVEEYIGDMYRQGEPDEEEPDWVKHERETFTNFRDKNKDGFMDNQEVKDWITPADFDHAEAEARHLIYEADSDADEKLTKDEIIEKYDLFVGSQATDFGEALTRHDEF
ncbi:calumenin-B [Anopheles funestus]|uniref:calumenin-B n=1 Tax=Anopheles funestus TaxID=62324 RepID=UPI0020C6098B|nr:calumenin-B [Anopheles funestus]XP_049291707.1 calumenin-B [Anopheles funestus]XP_049291708.1 calumenin-B [Anopheles funestus]XP_049291709.1 calumenin-B [Anopheles funestus]